MLNNISVISNPAEFLVRPFPCICVSALPIHLHDNVFPWRFYQGLMGRGVHYSPWPLN